MSSCIEGMVQLKRGSGRCGIVGRWETPRGKLQRISKVKKEAAVLEWTVWMYALVSCRA